MLIFSLLYTTSVQAATLHKGGTISADETWTSDNVYIIDSNLTIDSAATLTIQAGTVVKFWSSGIVVNGILDAQGTADNPEVFTSDRDDRVGGDTDGDSGSNSPAAGD